MKVIAPFGPPRVGTATWDTIWDNTKYKTVREALKANDYVHGDYVVDDEGRLGIQLYHTKSPDIRKLYTLQFQNPVAGIDVLDDQSALNIAISLLKEG